MISAALAFAPLVGLSSAADSTSGNVRIARIAGSLNAARGVRFTPSFATVARSARRVLLRSRLAPSAG